METYKVTLTGTSPILMHKDNIEAGEAIKKWQIDPQNKELNKCKGDDRVPAWTWLGYTYHDDNVFGIDSDNLMTCLREGGAKVSTGKGKETYKRQTQSGLLVDEILSPLLINGKTIPWQPFKELNGDNDFEKHMELAEQYGFSLRIKRAKIGRNKHVRVRPEFSNWTLVTHISVIDPEISGITQPILQRILDMAGWQCGLCDWRPSSPTPGQFGRFNALVEVA